MTRFLEGEHLDDVMAAFADHTFRSCNRPWISAEQMSELAPVIYRAMVASRRQVKPRRNSTQGRRKPTVNKGSQHEARRLVRRRSAGICEADGYQKAQEWHHRKNRSQGGRWEAANGLHLCSQCHRWATEHPDKARQVGWSIRSHEDPEQVPVKHGVQDWVLLSNDGSVSPVETQGEAS